MLEDKILKLERAAELGIRPSQVKDTADTNGYATEIQALRKEVETYKEMVEELIVLVDELKSQKESGIRLYSVDDFVKMTGCSKKTAYKVFNDPDLPLVCNSSKRKLAEENALRNYFSKTHNNSYWRKMDIAARKKAQDKVKNDVQRKAA